MAILTKSAIQEALKTYYLPNLRDQINREADPLWAEMEKSTRLVSGDKVKFALRYGKSGGIGARAEDGTLPTPNARKTKQVEVDTKNLFARMQINEKAIKASRENAGAFAPMLEQTLDDLMVDAKDYVQFQVYGDGTGKIATLAQAASAATTLTLDSVIGLAEGMLVDVINGGDGSVLHSEVEITGVDYDNKQVTVSTAITAGTDDFLVRSGSYNLEMTGMTKIFTADNTLYGLDRSTYKFFNPTRVNVGGEINEIKIQEGLDLANTITGVRHDFFIGTHGVRRAWFNLLKAQRQSVNTVQLKGGWEAPAYQNGSGQTIPFIAAKYAKTGKLWAIARKNFEVAWYGDWEWLDRDGEILRAVANKPAWEATLQMYAEIVCDLPRGMVEFYGITEH